MKIKIYILSIIIAILSSVTFNAIAQDLTITWSPNTESDLQGYNIYYGKYSRDYGPPINLPKSLTTYTFSNIDSGDTYYISVTAVDLSGNESGLSYEVSKTVLDQDVIDIISPIVSINSPTTEKSYEIGSAQISIAGVSSDSVGVTQILWSNSGGGSGIATGIEKWSVDNIPLTEGKNVITVTASDKAGNASTDILTVTYTKVDTILPVVTITSHTSGKSYETKSNSLNIKGIASDAVGVTQVLWSNSKGGSGTATGTENWSVNNIPLTEGENEIKVTAWDAAKNISSDSITMIYTKVTNDSWTILTQDDFETGWGNFKGGGNDCRRSINDAQYAHQGSFTARIRDNSGESSSFYYNSAVDVNTPGYSHIKIQFWYYPVSMEKNEDFFVEYYDGKNWNIVRQYIAGKDFENGTFFHEEGLILDKSDLLAFPKDMKLRFRCDASGNNDKIYIDEIVVSARKEVIEGPSDSLVYYYGSELSESSYSKNINYGTKDIVGDIITAAEAGKITTVGFRSASSYDMSWTIAIYKNKGAWELFECITLNDSGSGWHDAVLKEPLMVSAGEQVLVAVVGDQSWRMNYNNYTGGWANGASGNYTDLCYQSTNIMLSGDYEHAVRISVD